MPNRDTIVVSAIILAVVAAGVVVYVLSSPEPELTFETASPTSQSSIDENAAFTDLPTPSATPQTIAGIVSDAAAPTPQPVSASAATGPADWGLAGMLAAMAAGSIGIFFATKKA